MLGLAQGAAGQTTTFDYLNSSGSQKAITWNTSLHSAGFGHRWISVDPGNLTTLNLQARHNSATWRDVMVINSLGNIGIGNSAPAYKFDVTGSWAFRQDGYFYNSTAYAHETSSGQYLHFKISQGKGYVGMNSSNSLILQSNGGNVGIGTLNPDHKLDVKGSVHATEVIVNVNVPADYVFEETYSLKSLDEVETFVKEHYHLPGIPSAKELKESGWEVGEMGNKLLEKVEELTLYLIAMKKQNDEMKKEIEELKAKLARWN